MSEKRLLAVVLWFVSAVAVFAADIDSAAATSRTEWRKIVEDVRARDAWDELGMDPRVMRRLEETTGFDDWTDPQLSAIYWAARGNCTDIVRQATFLYLKNHKKK